MRNGGGVIDVFSQDGGPSKAMLGVHGDTGFVRADRSGGGSSQMRVDRNGGAIHVFNSQDGSATATLGILGDGGGFLRVKGTKGGAAEVKVDKNGGSVGVFGIGSTGSQAGVGRRKGRYRCRLDLGQEWDYAVGVEGRNGGRMEGWRSGSAPLNLNLNLGT